MLQDIRYAWRGLRLAPGFTLIAVLTLALGIGADAAFVGVRNALDASQRPSVSTAGLSIIVKRGMQTGRNQEGLGFAEFRLVESHPPDGATAVTSSGTTATVVAQIPGRAERVPAHFIPASYTTFFGLQPQAGRWISAQDDAGAAAMTGVVISNRLWRDWYHGDPAVVGHGSIKVNLRPFSIIGVAPAGFHGPGDYFGDSDLWLPLNSISGMLNEASATIADRNGVIVFIRPRAGVTNAQLAAELQPLFPVVTLPAMRPADPRVPAVLDVIANARYYRNLDSRESWMVFFLACLILIAACANLANLLYARGAQRAGEVAVRASLGASSGRLLQLFIAEALILAMVASLLGAAMAVGALRLFIGAIPALPFSRYGHITVTSSLDAGVFLYALGAGLVAALLVGGLTAWRTSRVPPLRVLAASGAASGMTPRGNRVRTSLVAIQVTAAVLLVMTAGVTIENFLQQRARRGTGPVTAHYDEDRLVSARIGLELLKFNEVQGRAFYDELVSRVRSLPGVEEAAVSDDLITSSYSNLETEPPAGGRVGSARLTRVNFGRISPSFLKTIGVPLTRGRNFTAFDTAGAPKVAILSESAAASLWPNEDPVGRRVKFGPSDWLTVTGVIADPVSSADNGPIRPSNVMFIPFAQWYQSGALIVVRSATPQAVLEPLRLAINELNPDVAVYDATTRLDQVRYREGLGIGLAALIIALGTVALGISMLGVYGVIAYFVSTRRREFGIRLALGATPPKVVKLVVDHAVHVVLIGLLPGVFLASVGSRFTQARLASFTPTNITTWFVVPALILAAGVIAGYLPARRAGRVDPNVALRDL